MKFVLNADDFGLDDDTVKATVACFDQHGLTSATIMVNMPSSEQALTFAKSHPEFSFGVHLTYVADTVEAPILSPDELKSLTRADGRFRESKSVRKDALLHRLSVQEIAAETEAQIGKALDCGVPVSHVDSHGHLHKFAPFQEALRSVLPKFGIRKVRMVQDTYLRRPWKTPGYWLGPWMARGIKSSFESTDHFYMPTTVFEKGWILPFIDRVSHGKGCMEVGFHPGNLEAWRADEARDCVALAQELRKHGHSLCNWNDV